MFVITSITFITSQHSNIRIHVYNLMTTSMRSVTYRLYPKREYEEKMLHFLDGLRRTYNHLVEMCRIYIGFRMDLPSEFDLMGMATRMRQEDPWLQDIHSHCFASVAKRVHEAFVSWMKMHSKGTGFPRFKNDSMFDSFTYTYKTDYGFVSKDCGSGMERIRLGMIGLVKYSNPYIMEGERKTATVFRRRVKDHYEWYVTVVYALEDLGEDIMYLDPSEGRDDAGLDLGLENLATMSDGKVIPNDRTYRRKEEELSALQRRLSGCEKGTPEYSRIHGKLSHKFKKLRNHRKDMFHKISRELSLRYADIVMEDLSVREMAADSPKGMRKSYRDAGWGIFTRMTCYKVEETGHRVIFVNPAYTSQICSSCGTLVPKDLSVRMHECPHCGLRMSRDRNAAINILNRGLGLQTGAGICPKCCEG